MRRVALLNPYHAGSHAQWADGMAREWPLAAGRAGEALEVEVFSLPGRHWKWRMHAAALVLVERMKASGVFDRGVDAFLVTDMLDVAQLRGALPPGERSKPIILYFHENQLTFPAHPERPPAEWDGHYAFMNVSGALLADAVWFNSRYHRNLFLEALPGFISSFPSPRPVDAAARIQQRSEVVPIGIEADILTVGQGPRGTLFGEGAPVVVWNHRWEYDKGPSAFLSCLDEAAGLGFEFRLAVVGEQFERVPDAFMEMRERYADRILVWGYRETRAEYLDVLRSGDIALVTAHHDFFGIGVLEAAAAGLHVIAPKELAYPDHFSDDQLCDREGLGAAFQSALRGYRSDFRVSARAYSWDVVADAAWRALKRVWGAAT